MERNRNKFASENRGNCGRSTDQNRPYHITAEELSLRLPDEIPEEMIPSCWLIYSSPATLSYNSPGALGFGVKRAGLVIPESAMLLISPSCCGRNSTILSHEEDYADRMFYLLMDETDLVTGRHLTRINDAIREILEVSDPKPKVIVLCITCVDALLGTDLERIARKAQEEIGVIVIPSYMYALEREGRKPPMTAIRATIYSLLTRGEVDPTMVNLMGFFTKINEESELFALLRSAGIKTINQVSAMESLAEYQEMGKANFNLLLHPESRYAAEELRQRTGMPYVELPRLFHPEKIHRQYQLFASALGIALDDQEYYEKTSLVWKDFASKHAGTRFAVGEMMNGNPYEVAASLCEMGMSVPLIFSNVTAEDAPYLRRLSKVSPETKIYTGISPSMLHYERGELVDVAIGKDAAYYCPEAKCVPWNEERQPYGFQGVLDFLSRIEEVMAE